jgi:hypothetical protein
MPRTQQDQPRKRAPEPAITANDDDETPEGDVTRMEEAGNKLGGGRQAAEDDADVDETDAADSDDEVLEDDEAEEPIGGRV